MHTKKWSYYRFLFFLLLVGLSACTFQMQVLTPEPSTNADPNVADIVNATLTAIAQDNPQGITPQTASTPSSVDAQPTAIQSQPLPSDSPAPTGNITYFWPRTLPEGFVLSREISYANTDGFALTFINPSSGAISLLGGAEADQDQYCANYENNPSEPVSVRELEGCFPPSTGGGFTVEWKENGTYYSVGVMGISKEWTLAIAEQLESVDLSTFLERLVP
jgi:hypothetical protein